MFKEMNALVFKFRGMESEQNIMDQELSTGINLMVEHMLVAVRTCTDEKDRILDSLLEQT